MIASKWFKGELGNTDDSVPESTFSQFVEAAAMVGNTVDLESGVLPLITELQPQRYIGISSNVFIT